MVLLSCHSALSVIGKAKEQKNVLIGLYVFGLALAIFYIVVPESLGLLSQPKLYLPNYYVPGHLRWVLHTVFNIAVPVYFFFHMLRAYREAGVVQKNRIKFFALALACAYGFGSTPIFLVYDIPIDPLWGILFIPLYSIPFTYGILKYELMDIRILGKRAFLYGIVVVAVGLIISLFSYLNNFIGDTYPDFPLWILPLMSALISVGIGFFVWSKARENDLLKYEFIHVVTHKFRTPLTHIKWSSENLLQGERSAERKREILSVQESVFRLVELTNLLINVSETEEQSFLYQIEKTDFSAYVQDVLDTYAMKFKEKKFDVDVSLGHGIHVPCDTARLKLALQIFLDNAVVYTPTGGSIKVSLRRHKGTVECLIADSGIGITKDEMPHLFSRFYRGAKSQHMDTEGMGIGLFLAKKIIERHGGRLWVESDGRDKGSVFKFTLPAH